MNRKSTLLLSFLFFLTGTVTAQSAKADTTLEGRWDLTISQSGQQLPSWLEVRHSGTHTLIGQFVSTSGSARPISKVHVTGNQFRFAIPPQWERGAGDLVVEGQLASNQISGTITYPDGSKHNWTGVRAPALRRQKEPQWGSPIQLFNGKDLTGWKALGTMQWVVENGILKSPKSGANLVSEAKFDDFKLQVEFRYPKGSNSGVYLRGRYEVQISDSKGLEPLVGELGAIYGFLAPNEQVAKSPGEWQTYEITLVGRLVTVVANGKTIICNQEIPGITGGALDSKEGEPGPILIQGDHGPIEYRRIVITPAR